MATLRRKATLPDPVRQRIAKVIEDRGLSMSELSKDLGKAHSYLSQYLTRGIPDQLPEKIREKLGELLGFTDQEMGGPPDRARDSSIAGVMMVPSPGAQAGAGGGRLMADDDLDPARAWPLPKDYVEHVLSISHTDLEVIEIVGDSMVPTLYSGDRALVNRRDKKIAMPGIFMLYDGDAEVVKRVELIPASNPPRVRLSSDNKLHAEYEVLVSEINVAGRLAWYARRM